MFPVLMLKSPYNTKKITSMSGARFAPAVANDALVLHCLPASQPSVPHRLKSSLYVRAAVNLYRCAQAGYLANLAAQLEQPVSFNS